MNDELKQIAYKEGAESYLEDVTSILNNPYDGVSDALAEMWQSGYWDMWYEEKQ